MSRKRRMFFRAAHRDKAERAIIDALKAVGASVYQVNGKDILDLLVGYKGVTYLFEVKTRDLETVDKRDGRTYKRTTKVSKGQQEFLATWKGGPARVVHTPEEALMAIGAPVEGVLQPLGASEAASAMAAMEERMRRETAAVVPPPRKSNAATAADVAAAINADPMQAGRARVEGGVVVVGQPPPPGISITAAPRKTGKDPKALATSASYKAKKP